MKVLGLDIGSSSVKAGILRGSDIVGRVVKREFPTRYEGVRAEVEPREILRALAGAIEDLGAAAPRVETIALGVMSPAWVAMDHEGRAITPIVTHQDRRSVDIARELEGGWGRSGI
jgi:sugar (pentulose or hexulose) kinase